MKKTVRTALMIVFLILISGCGKEQKGNDSYMSSEEMIKNSSQGSYVIGADLAKVLEKSDSLFNYDAFIQGFTDQYKRRPMLLTEEEMEAVRKKYQKNSPRLKENPYPKLSPEGSLIASERFMLENRKKEGVIETESGLQYQIIKEGSGRKPGKDGKVLAHYIGTLRKGEVFEDTYEKGSPAELALNGVVKGLGEGLMLMKEGGRYKFFIPPQLGYGSKSVGPIMSNSVVIFEVELIKVLN